VVQTYAFWELSLITSHFEARRATIFQENGRLPESTWKQILKVCITEIESIKIRINATTPKGTPASSGTLQTETDAQSLPRISARPIRTEDVMQSQTTSNKSQAIAQYADQFVKWQGSSKEGPILTPQKARKLIEDGTDQAAKKLHLTTYKEALETKGFVGLVNSVAAPLVSSPFIGPFLRQTFRRRVRLVVTGSPYSRTSTILDAVKALTTLVVCSLKEDTVGQVARDVPAIIRSLMSTITQIENFVTALPPHWTDLSFKENCRKVPEVVDVMDVLKENLDKILVAHGEYLETEGLTRKEIREAKSIVSQPEMQKIEEK
jgi:nucleoporin NDC1